jgi:hypothetical protein
LVTILQAARRNYGRWGGIPWQEMAAQDIRDAQAAFSAIPDSRRRRFRATVRVPV